MFSRDLRDGVASGEITVSIRLWSRPKVRSGGRYQTADVVIEVDSVEMLPFSAVTDEDICGTGDPDREALRARAAHAGPVDDDTLVYRIEFHLVQHRDRADVSARAAADGRRQPSPPEPSGDENAP